MFENGTSSALADDDGDVYLGYTVRFHSSHMACLGVSVIRNVFT
jgi:hypothetical protein